jgi:hypothetical protein
MIWSEKVKLKSGIFEIRIFLPVAEVRSNTPRFGYRDIIHIKQTI